MRSGRSRNRGGRGGALPSASVALRSELVAEALLGRDSVRRRALCRFIPTGDDDHRVEERTVRSVCVCMCAPSIPLNDLPTRRTRSLFGCVVLARASHLHICTYGRCFAEEFSRPSSSGTSRSRGAMFPAVGLQPSKACPRFRPNGRHGAVRSPLPAGVPVVPAPVDCEAKVAALNEEDASGEGDAVLPCGTTECVKGGHRIYVDGRGGVPVLSAPSRPLWH